MHYHFPQDRKALWREARSFVQREAVLTVAVTLAVGSSLFSVPKLSYIDFPVLGILYSLMLVVGALAELKILDSVAVYLMERASSRRQLAFILTAVTYVASMFITNDVALMVFVPLAIIVGRTEKLDMGRIIVYQTLAANLGSSLTPMGNPQNLFLYARYGFGLLDFLSATGVIACVALLYLGYLLYHERSLPLTVAVHAVTRGPRQQIIVFSLLLIMCLLTVLRLVDYRLTAGLVTLAVLVLRRELFWHVDFSLLVTFVGFFIFIGNISHLPIVTQIAQLLEGRPSIVYFSGIILSQFISNVPAAMLLAGFTTAGKELLLGVNVGGLGTLIASMASVISYKLYAAEHPTQVRNYLHTFMVDNFLGLIIIGGATYVIGLRIEG